MLPTLLLSIIIEYTYILEKYSNKKKGKSEISFKFHFPKSSYKDVIRFLTLLLKKSILFKKQTVFNTHRNLKESVFGSLVQSSQIEPSLKNRFKCISS